MDKLAAWSKIIAYFFCETRRATGYSGPSLWPSPKPRFSAPEFRPAHHISTSDIVAARNGDRIRHQEAIWNFVIFAGKDTSSSFWRGRRSAACLRRRRGWATSWSFDGSCSCNFWVDIWRWSLRFLVETYRLLHFVGWSWRFRYASLVTWSLRLL